MKKLIILSMMLLVSGLLSAQTKKAVKKAPKMPADTTAPAVNTEDPMNEASWKRNRKNARAEFTDSTLKEERTVTYDATGNMVISDNSGDSQNNNAYPPSIAEFYTQKYPNEKFRVLWGKDKTGNKIYYINRKSEVFWFDQDGKFTSRTQIKSK
ncbi:MAG TPA: hypothetical protein PL029_01895 [Bacteroidia bacterium]|nr:hypothetical protein [Bacteroidia bacterium]